MITAIRKELLLRKDELEKQDISSIYFGGGTPSLLEEKEIDSFLSDISKYFTVKDDAEITLEANPDDMTLAYLNSLRQTGINRLSVGIQSFFDEDLKYMNRAHSRDEGIRALEAAYKTGFDDFSLDLIYGSHTTTNKMWVENIETALSFTPNHISAYCLTIEPQTVFGNWLEKGKLNETDDLKANWQFDYLQEQLIAHDFIHYEISNFAVDGHIALHNSSYWKGDHYLGLGPGAHSYYGKLRMWNLANNALFIKSIQKGDLPIEEEFLSDADQYNEMIMTSLRTMWGLKIDRVKQQFGEKYAIYLDKQLNDSWLSDKIMSSDNTLYLTKTGKKYADRVASMFFMVE